VTGIVGTDDALTPFVFEHAALRGGIVRLRDTSRAILAAHPYPPAIARALGELLAASALLAATLKLDGSLIVQMRGNGPLGLLVVECDGSLALRATAQWSDDAVARLGPEAPLHALAGAPDAARLAITLDPRGAGTLYQGIVALQGTSIAASIEHYLATSEQLPSRLILGTANGTTAGLLLQRLPQSTAEDTATWQRASHAVTGAQDALLAVDDTTALLRALFPADDVRVFPARAARFECKCSPERAQRALRIAGRVEVEAALAEKGRVEVVCEYCGRLYLFEPPAARAVFDVVRT
jgi:molecular chaperone Hsp33